MDNNNIEDEPSILSLVFGMFFAFSLLVLSYYLFYYSLESNIPKPPKSPPYRTYFKTSDDLLHHCAFESYINPMCADVRFIVLYSYINKGLCTSDNLLCTDYNGSADYYSDLADLEKDCVSSDSKKCLAFNSLSL